MTLQTQGSRIVDSNGDPIRLKGTNMSGWLNMQNFITGYAASESMMRAAMLAVLGQDKYELFFETQLTSFYRRTGIDLNLEGNDLQHVSLDGLQDHLISVAIGESAETGRDVTTQREAWAR